MVLRRCFPLKSVLKYLSVKNSYKETNPLICNIKINGLVFLWYNFYWFFEQISVSIHPISMIIWSLYLLFTLMLQVFIKLIDFLQLIFIKKKHISLDDGVSRDNIISKVKNSSYKPLSNCTFSCETLHTCSSISSQIIWVQQR